MGHADFAGAGNGAASDETGVGYRVMRRAKRPRAGQSGLRWQEAGDGVNPSGLETFLEAHRRQDRRNTFREHGLAGAGRSDKQHVMPAGHRDLDRALGVELSTHIAKVFAAAFGFVNLAPVFAADRIDGVRAVDEIHDFSERANGINGYAFHDGRLSRIAKRDQHVRNLSIARKHGKTATFMPKPLFGDNGSGMHTHQSLWKKGKPLFAGNEYAGLSKMALNYIGGLLKHAHALCAFCSPTTNSYKRLVPGYEAPVNLAYSSRNRSAAIRIPTYSENPKAKRVEYRPPDPAANPYVAFAAMLMAGLDGIQNKIDPGEPMDKNLYELPPEEMAKVPQVPGSLEEAIVALEKDHAFLLKGDVFTQDFLDMWIATKRKEHDALRLRPHPYEFFLYYDV